MRRVWLGWVLVAAVMHCASPAAAAKRVALVIGNSAYASVGVLANPGKDAKVIALTLQGLGFEVDLALDLAAQPFRDKLKVFGGRSQTAEIALVYYAGHGVEFDGTNYLVPTDATLALKRDTRFEAIALDDVREAASGASKLRLVILDACRNNPFPMLDKGGKRAVSRGLVRVEAGANELVAYSAREGTVAADGNGDNSPFALALAKHLAEPGVEIGYLFRLVRDDVQEATGREQEPFLYGTLGKEQLYLKGELVVAAPPAPAKIDVGAEWDRVNGSRSISVLQAFRDKHQDDPVYKALAEQQLALLAPKSETKTPAKAACADVLMKIGNLDKCLKPGAVFRDLDIAPQMVVISPGEFMMGSSAVEVVALKTQFINALKILHSEGPQHTVRIPQPFAAGQSPVTRGEFAAFVKATGRKMDGGCYAPNGTEWKLDATRSWQSPGFQQDDTHPAVCVSWYDAQAYVKWLSGATGKTYRLLTESEREYATRAGTKTPFWFVWPISTTQANYNGNFTSAGGIKGEYRQSTVPVLSFRPNPFGLYQVHGNVLDWVQDCFHETYSGNPPTDGSAWNDTDASCRRSLRGGSWLSDPLSLRAASRSWHPAGNPYSNLGFRVERTLIP